MTQQDIVQAVNSLAVGYNVSWQDIKFDADKAIVRINSYIGAKYPKMSEVLIGSPDSYAFRSHGRLMPIFDDSYILSIVIPFIASEILARDEEFTTVYNKYVMEVEDGLYNMFTREFNRVPWEFRQDDTTGVFFAEDTPHRIASDMHDHCHHEPVFTFNIHYHVNNNDIIYDSDFPKDVKDYSYGSSYKLVPVKDKDEDKYVYYTSDGITRYTITGWYQDPLCTKPAEMEYTITSDVNVYAGWKKSSVFKVYYIAGANESIPYTDKLDSKIRNLVIPSYIDGKYVDCIRARIPDPSDPTHIKMVNTIPSDNHLESITLSPTIKTIGFGAFDNFKGKSIVFKGNNMKFESGSFNLSNSSICTTADNRFPIRLPKNISINKDAFGTNVSPITTYPSGNVRRIDILINSYYADKPSTLVLDAGMYQCGNMVYAIHFLGENEDV